MYKLVYRIFVFLLLWGAVISPSEARLGERIKTFKLKNKDDYKLFGIVVQDDLKYYSFTLLLDSEKLSNAPGFKGGLTVTVRRGKIIGQSLAINIGTNPFVGTDIACDKTLVFACETLGREIPSSEKRVKEKQLIQTAIGLALSGQPQELKFPDTEGKIVFKRSGKGELLVAAVHSK